MSRHVLAVARTHTSVNRLLDVLPVLQHDHRIQVVFTVETGSQFHDGLADRLRHAGFRVIDWDDAVRLRFDLVIAASDKGPLDSITAPLVLLPHGAGYHRRTNTSAPEGRQVSGLAPTALNRPAPTTVVVAHPAQLDQLRTVSEDAARDAVVVGDPCLDRMLASTTVRHAYRAAFDARGRRLVVLSSTWGPASLLGTDSNLPARLLAELPVDDYRLAAVIHPNVWTRHGEWSVRGWLSDALDAGLMLTGHDEAWKAALVAADLVIGDHGSVTCYAAALGTPVLLASDGGHEVTPGSHMDSLRRAVPSLATTRSLTAQIDQVISHHDPERLVSLSDPLFAYRGHTAQRLRSTLYLHLGLAAPDTAAPSPPVPTPGVARRRPAALAVRGTVHGLSDGHALVSLHRTPAVLHDRWGTDQHPVHLMVRLDEADQHTSQAAAVLVSTHAFATIDAARSWCTTTLGRFPGARIAAAAATNHAVLRIRSAFEVLIRPQTMGTDSAAWASAVHACLMAGVRLSEITELTVSTGPTKTTADIAVTPMDDQG